MIFLITLLALLMGGLVAFAGIQFYLAQKGTSSHEALSQMALAFQREMEQLRSAMSQQVLDLSKQMNQQLRENTRFLVESHQGYQDAVGQVQHRLGQLQTATQSMVEIGKDISSLQQILKAPKLRGGLGELGLEVLLRQILPDDHFSLQYMFRDGSKVDAVIRLGEGTGLIPVDAKFPLENFKRILEAQGDEAAKLARKEFIRDVKKHVDDIAQKYILPDEQTYDFALMYIPAENVYYEIILKDDQTENISEYARMKSIIPVSPNSFYAYLQAIVRGLKGLRIERSAQIILQSLSQLETDFKKFLEDFEKIESHLENSLTAYRKAEKRFGRLQDRLSSLELQQEKPLLSEAVSPPS